MSEGKHHSHKHHSHSHADEHHHAHQHDFEHMAPKRLAISAVLNLVITIAQVVGGILSNSLSLLSDALHNFSDGMALVLAWVAQSVSGRKANMHKTFGYRRIEIIAAFVNSFILIFISIYIFVEAYHRYFHPEPIVVGIMLVVAVIGLLANVISVILLHPVSQSSLNIKAAYLHLLGDTLSSVAVILGALAIYYFQVLWVDPLISVVVGVYVMVQAWPILKKSMHVLMQGSPEMIDVEEIEHLICELDGVKGIHHVHIWNLDEKTVLFEAHITLKNDLNVSETQKIHSIIKDLLNQEFHIHHTTLQFEYEVCSAPNCGD